MRNLHVRHYLGVALSIILVVLANSCARKPQAPAQVLYAAIPETSTVVLFQLDSSAQASPIARIEGNPSDKPVDVATNFFGDVFIASEGGSVRVYGGRDYKYELIRTIQGPHTRIEHPTSIAVDRAGSFYVADTGGDSGSPRIEWFPEGLGGNVMPDRVISGPHTGLTSPRGLANDASGRLFVADEKTNRVLIFAADARDDASPVTILTGLHSPERVTVDEELNIYVTNKGNNTISCFALNGPESWTPNGTIRSDLMHQPEGIAVDRSGRIAVAVVGGVLFFAPDARGVSQPVLDLRGSTPMNAMGIFIR